MEKKKYKGLILDDEPLAASDLKATLEETNQFARIEMVHHLDSARSLLESATFDFVFLDIQLSGGDTGFDLVEDIPDHSRIIFVTAYDQHALRAFEVNALDYLLKPVNSKRLLKTLEKNESEYPKSLASKQRLNMEDFVFVKLTNSYHFIEVSRIKLIKAADDYSKVLTDSEGIILVLKSMKEWECRLPENRFIRVHRSTIINLNFVERLEPWFNNTFRVYLKGIDEPVSMSRKYFGIVKDKLA